MGASLNARALARPIRVVVFGGAYFEATALRFLVLLNEHPEIDLVGVFSEGPGQGFAHRVANLLRRRGVAALPILFYEGVRTVSKFMRRPVQAIRFRRALERATRAVSISDDIHAPVIVARVRALVPDLGLVYGAPILRPELFEIPSFGTIGIHHGKLPQYRGKKTTFWAMYNGDACAGVTIQKINAGLDTGEILREGEVPIGTKRYRTVEAEVEDLGLTLYIDSILAIKRGEARARPQPNGRFPLYRQPTPRQILRYLRMRSAASGPHTGGLR